MAYTDEYDLFATTTNDLHKKVARSIMVAAKDVINESAGTANHAERFVWASKVRLHPDNAIAEAHRWMLLVLDNATVATGGNAAADSDVLFVVNSLVDTMAGV